MSRARMQFLRRFSLLLFLFGAFSAAAATLPDFTRLVEENAPAVVNISTVYKARNPLGRYHLPEDMPIPEEGPLAELFRRFLDGEEERPEEVDSLGSGFIISPDGYILTNHHVVQGADEIIVRLHNRDTYQAKLVGSDEASDIALLKVEAENLPTVRIGDSSRLKIGAWVLAIGSPFGFDHTVTAGIVSAKGRSLPSENYVPYIQTDVAINPGNSGGPLFNLDGEVVGINSQIFSRSGGFMGLSFAVPIDLAMNVARQLREKGRVSRGYLGVLIQDLDQGLAHSFGLDHPRGALVSRVLPESPAARAGLQVGDVILGFNGREIRTSSELPPLVGSTPVGEEVVMAVQRKGKVHELRVKIEELPEREAAVEEKKEAAVQPQQGDRLGLVVRELNSAEIQELELPPGEGGVLVQSVKKGPAARAGIEEGDVLLMLGEHRIRDLAHYRRLVQALPAGREVPLLIQRDQGPVFIALKVP